MLTEDHTTPLTGGRGRLRPDAAASVARIDDALRRPLDINSAWRDPVVQQALRDDYERYLAGGPWAPIALRPSDSLHCYGTAIDTDDHRHHTPLLNEHGWTQTVYRSGVLVEPWHFEYNPNNDQHIGEDDMPTAEEVARAVWNYDMDGGDPLADGKQVRTETAGERLRQVRRSTGWGGTRLLQLWQAWRPGIPKVQHEGPQTRWVRENRDRLRRIDAEATANAAALKALAEARDVDPEEVADIVEQRVREALAGIEISLETQ